MELFERSRLLGGRATSFELDDVEVDNGQHVVLACCTAFTRFAQAVGMQEQLRWQERFDARILSRNGVSGRLRAGSLPAPFHLMQSFVTYPHLSLAEKMHIARALAFVIKNGRADSRHPERRRRKQSGSAQETFEEWLHRNGQGAGERRAFWDPFFIPALNAPFDRVSSEDALFVLRTAFLGDAAAARFGFSKVPLAHFATAAAARLDAVHLSTSVHSISVDSPDSAPRGGVILSLSRGDTITFDAVVLAVPPRQAARILGDPLRFGVNDLDGYDPYPIIDVHLWHDGGSIGLDFAAALDSPVQWIFEKAPGYLCCSFSVADEYLRLPTAELEKFAWSELRAFIPTLKKATLMRRAVTRNPEATWLPQMGRKRTKQQTADPRIGIAGSWTDTGWPDTMESAVRSGILAATYLLQRRRSSVASSVTA